MWVHHYFDCVDLDRVLSIQMNGMDNEIEFKLENGDILFWNFSDSSICELTYADLTKTLNSKDFKYKE